MWQDDMETPRTSPRAGIWRNRRVAASLAVLVAAVLAASPAGAGEKVKLSTFQANLCCFTVYVAQHLKLFEKHGVDVELVYGTGIQVANIMISGSAEVGAFSVEHGVAVTAQGKDPQLLRLNVQLTPLIPILRNAVPTPNTATTYTQQLRHL